MEQASAGGGEAMDVEAPPAAVPEAGQPGDGAMEAHGSEAAAPAGEAWLAAASLVAS